MHWLNRVPKKRLCLFKVTLHFFWCQPGTLLPAGISLLLVSVLGFKEMQNLNCNKKENVLLRAV